MLLNDEQEEEVQEAFLLFNQNTNIKNKHNV